MSDEHRNDAGSGERSDGKSTGERSDGKSTGERSDGKSTGDPDRWTPVGDATVEGAANEDGAASSVTRATPAQPADPDRTVRGTPSIDPDSTLYGTAPVDPDATSQSTPVAPDHTSYGADPTGIGRTTGSGDPRFAGTASRPTIPVTGPPRGEVTTPGTAGTSGHPFGDDSGTTQIETVPTFAGPQAYSQVDGGGRVPTAKFDHGEDTAHLPPAGQVPPAGRGPVVASSPSRRNRGRILAWTAATLALVLVIGLVGSELFFRNRVQNCMEKAFGDLTGSQTNVALSKKPVLLQALSNEFPYVQVDTKNESGTGMTLHARAEGISRSGDDTTIRTLDGTGSVPFDRVTELGEQAQNQDQSGGGSGLISAGEITQVSGNAADGTVSIEASVKALFVSIPVSTVIKPVIENGKPHFEVQKASAFVFGVPADFAQQIVDEVTTTMFGTFFDEVSIDDLKVTDTGVDFTVSGSDVTLIADNNTVAGNTVTCG